METQPLSRQYTRSGDHGHGFAVLFLVPFYFLISNSLKKYANILLDSAVIAEPGHIRQLYESMGDYEVPGIVRQFIPDHDHEHRRSGRDLLHGRIQDGPPSVQVQQCVVFAVRGGARYSVPVHYDSARPSRKLVPPDAEPSGIVGRLYGLRLFPDDLSVSRLYQVDPR